VDNGRTNRARGGTIASSAAVAVLLLLLIPGSLLARPAPASTQPIADSADYTVASLGWGSNDLSPTFSNSPALYKQRAKAKIKYGLIIDARDSNGNPVTVSRVLCTLQMKLYRGGVLKDTGRVNAQANLPPGYFNTVSFVCNGKPGWYVMKLQAVHAPSGKRTRSVSLKFKILSRS
jgi:hypothetical protein